MSSLVILCAAFLGQADASEPVTWELIPIDGEPVYGTVDNPRAAVVVLRRDDGRGTVSVPREKIDVLRQETPEERAARLQARAEERQAALEQRGFRLINGRQVHESQIALAKRAYDMAMDVAAASAPPDPSELAGENPTGAPGPLRQFAPHTIVLVAGAALLALVVKSTFLA